MNTIKISIIIPIYKVENELERCVRSVMQQTYQDIEIILVDDGSPDNCPKLCDEYAKEDHRIQVIHKKNGGLSDARNAGLEKASGQYILYVDSDDYIDTDACSRFIEIINKSEVELDIIVGNAIVHQNNKIQYMSHDEKMNGKIFSSKEYIINAIRKKKFYAPACFNLYRREFLISNFLYFKKEIYFEDMQMLPRVFLCSDKVACLGGTFYHYVVRCNSIMTSCSNEKKKKDSFQILCEWKVLFDEVKDFELKRALYAMLIRCYLHECRLYHVDKWIIPNVNEKFALRYCMGIKDRIKVVLFCVSPKIYIRL